MKKSKLLVLGIIALMLAGGLVLASYDSLKCFAKGDCYYWKYSGGTLCHTSECNVVQNFKQGIESDVCDCI